MIKRSIIELKELIMIVNKVTISFNFYSYNMEKKNLN